MADDDELYLVWSNEHRRWWGPAQAGYVDRIRDAGRYSRPVALAICAGAVIGTAQRLNMLPEIPVRLSDAVMTVAGMSGEPWR
jgi:hypothetical protein